MSATSNARTDRDILAPAATMLRRATSRIHTAKKRVVTPRRKRRAIRPHAECGNPSLAGSPRAVNVIPSAASFASHIQIAEHIDDPTAEDYGAQGDAELLEPQELDKFFEKVRDVRGTVVLDHSFSKCKKLMLEIYDCAKNGVFKRHACNTLPTICSPSSTSEGDTCLAIRKKEAQPMRARTGRQPIGTFCESPSVPHVAQIARFSPVLSPSESGRQHSTNMCWGAALLSFVGASSEEAQVMGRGASDRCG